MRYIKSVVTAAGLAIFAAGAHTAGYAASISSADLFYPTYGQARHFDQSNEFLGSQRTGYDGVGFGAFLPGQINTISIWTNIGALFGSGEREYLSMWVDWDHDRTWSDSEEVLDLDDFWFDAGVQEYRFDVFVPIDAVLGTTFLRTRLSFDGDLTTGGDYVTGEVEDYAIRIGDDVHPVPEAETWGLLAFGLLFVAGAVRVRGIG